MSRRKRREERKIVRSGVVRVKKFENGKSECGEIVPSCWREAKW
jgi:hypothetical protein